MKLSYFTFLLIAFFFTEVTGIKAQNNQVSGTVVDAGSGEALPGVNISIPGTTSGTSTDRDGNYMLKIPSLKDSLRFSFIGYESQTVAINGRTTINVELQPSVYSGKEMVVVGYGTQQRENLTGSVSSLSTSDFENIPAANTTQMIQGKLPGVTVSSFSPQPGRDNAQIRIRGIGSFNSGQSPLVVIDGVTSSVDAFGQI